MSNTILEILNQILSGGSWGVSYVGPYAVAFVVGFFLGMFVYNDQVRRVLGVPANAKTMDFLMAILRAMPFDIRVEVISKFPVPTPPTNPKEIPEDPAPPPSKEEFLMSGLLDEQADLPRGRYKGG